MQECDPRTHFKSSLIVTSVHTRKSKICHFRTMNEKMSDRLKTLRKATKLTQADVSAATGVDRAHLSKLETGAKGASIDSIAALADFYDVSIDYLYRGSTQNFSGPKQAGYSANGPEEIAMIEMWREMDDSQRRLLMIMLRNSIQNLAI